MSTSRAANDEPEEVLCVHVIDRFPTSISRCLTPSVALFYAVSSKKDTTIFIQGRRHYQTLTRLSLHAINSPPARSEVRQCSANRLPLFKAPTWLQPPNTPTPSICPPPSQRSSHSASLLSEVKVNPLLTCSNQPGFPYPVEWPKLASNQPVMQTSAIPIARGQLHRFDRLR
ncbi:hypothetical protein TcWFU_002308 [Taenia crassiceps]|uniref:Uncharacterized protein n=1 Tax=Taenia crassiceps TaxID=6207 RepID=A0ABR4Q4P7_9CEST